MNARGKIKVFTGLLVTVAIISILCAAFFAWQLSEGIFRKDTWGISSNVVMIVILLFVGALGIIGSVRHSQNCLNSFMLCCCILIVICVAEIVVTSVGVAMCDDLSSDDENKIWDFICSSSSWVLLIPMSVLVVVLIAGIVFNALLKKAIVEDDNGGESESNLSYYPS